MSGDVMRQGFAESPSLAAPDAVDGGYALVKLGRFHPTPFSPVTFIEKTHPDRIRVDCRGEEGSYSFLLPIDDQGLLRTGDGFVMVPLEPTEPMQRAGAAKYWDQQKDEPGLIGLPQATEIYKAMIAAVKKP